MASGLEHDKATKFCSLLFGLTVGLVIDYKTGLIAGTSFLIGGLWLSPDLDTESKPLKRWGILKIFWYPYRKIIPHRSFLSHGIIIGSSLRLIYLLILAKVLLFLMQGIETITFFNAQVIQANLTTLITEKGMICFIGIEMSAWLHLLQDNINTNIFLKKFNKN